MASMSKAVAEDLPPSVEINWPGSGRAAGAARPYFRSVNVGAQLHRRWRTVQEIPKDDKARLILSMVPSAPKDALRAAGNPTLDRLIEEGTGWSPHSKLTVRSRAAFYAQATAVHEARESPLSLARVLQALEGVSATVTGGPAQAPAQTRNADMQFAGFPKSSAPADVAEGLAPALARARGAAQQSSHLALEPAPAALAGQPAEPSAICSQTTSHEDLSSDEEELLTSLRQQRDALDRLIKERTARSCARGKRPATPDLQVSPAGSPSQPSPSMEETSEAQTAPSGGGTCSGAARDFVSLEDTFQHNPRKPLGAAPGELDLLGGTGIPPPAPANWPSVRADSDGFLWAVGAEGQGRRRLHRASSGGHDNWRIIQDAEGRYAAIGGTLGDTTMLG